jgi:transposase
MTAKKAPEDLLSRGRPTDYKPEYCRSIIPIGKEGGSKVDIAKHLNVSVKTLYNWMAEFPEFFQAMEMAEVYAHAWWAEQGKKALWTPGFNTSAWSRSMGARFPRDWRENKNVEVTGKDGGAIELDVTTTINVDQMSARALDALEEALEIIIAGADADGDEDDEDEGPAN